MSEHGFVRQRCSQCGLENDSSYIHHSQASGLVTEVRRLQALLTYHGINYAVEANGGAK